MKFKFFLILIIVLSFVYSTKNKLKEEECPREYTVVQGDTLKILAERFSTTIEKIMKENNLENPDYIAVGQKLKIPC